MKKYVCGICGYVYDEAKGIPEAGIAPGTKWEELPDDWVCPMCGAPKDVFEEQNGGEAEGRAPAAAPEKHDGEMAELSALELSALCSNLARGCEKQYKAEEAGLFTELAGYLKSAAAPAEEPDFKKLLEKAADDLNIAFPEANAAAAESGDRGALRALTWSEKVTRMLKSILERYEKEGDAMLRNTGVYVCTICGFIFIGDRPPEICPVCKVPGWKFEKVEER